MKELNTETLHRALAELPRYEAPVSLWGEICLAMDADDEFVARLKQLPVYQAPDEIWSNIEAALPEKSEPRKLHIRRSILRWSAAAAIAVLLAATWLLIQPRPDDMTAEERITVSRQVFNEEISAAYHEKEDDAFQLVSELCRERAPVCEKPEFLALKTELDELTLAKTELKKAIDRYNDDPGLAAQFVRLERERSAVLKQMIQLI